MDRPKKPARKKSASGGSRTIVLKPEQFRSMILDKLRLDIDAKRAAYEQAKKLAIKDLPNMSYYKMAYWKMHYWKKGAEVLDPSAPVINPAMPVVRAGAVGRKRVK